MSRPPSVFVGQHEVQKLVAERQHSGAGGESGRDDESVVPELDAPRHCAGYPRGDHESELVEAKPVCNEVQHVLVLRNKIEAE